MAFHFLDHTADIRVACTGATLEELFESAAHALYSVALRGAQARMETEHTITAEADDLDDALIRWLQELLFLMEVKYFVGTFFTFERLDEQGIRVVVTGGTCLPDERETEIKAATYHGAGIIREPGGYRVELIFDV